VGLLVFAADDAALRSFTFWTLGSVGGATWSQLGLASVGAGLPVLGAMWLARRLDVLMLGETDAEALGISVLATRRVVVVLCALAVGTSVALCGIIGFVGLVAPHLVRLCAGPMHRVVLPGSALLGSVLLMGADLVARTAVAPLELPVGVVTTLLGGPFLLWLLSRVHS
jgi:iron complex transport system permease protein